MKGESAVNSEPFSAWLRRNASFLVALVALMCSMVGTVAGYKVLQYQTEQNTLALIDAQKRIAEDEKKFYEHLIAGHPATEEWRGQVTAQINIINQKLDRLAEMEYKRR